MALEKQKDNIIPSGKLKAKRQRYPVTFVTVVFALVLVFFLVQGIILMNHHSVRAYNVGMPGSDNVAGTYRGMILREERVIRASYDGYVNFFQTNGEWVQKGGYLATLDRDGNAAEKIRARFYGMDVLSAGSIQKIRSVLKNAADLADPSDFSKVYEARANVEETILAALVKDSGSDYAEIFQEGVYETLNAPASGFFLNWTDGYESVSETALQKKSFDPEQYEVSTVREGSRVASGETVLKIAPDNQFRLVFPLSEGDLRILSGRKRITIRMPDGLELAGAFSLSNDADGNPLGVVFFQKYGGNYLSSRFVEFNILDASVTGYKIPESSIVTKNFFVVPEKMLGSAGSSSLNSVVVRTEDGIESILVTVYTYDPNPDNNLVIGEGQAYIYADALKAGMVLVSEGTEQESFTLGIQTTVEGVYQINNGYCVFKPIVRLRNSLETTYVVVSSGVKGGMRPYDRILLDAANMNENEIIFE
ncbi:MAG: hypothetical protein IK150_05510 [Lachnospiraceae bacterium]|nr:hypothetical protein [Lachnospiraceae bacterium]